ncbi:MAG: DUF6273 domain-containing protein [Synergistaceae bacterium]|nr:DUF6273 domain-containing protein [Synergistaceae bacterium]
MKSKMSKFIALALIVALLAPALLSAVPASAVPGDAKDLREGHWTEQHRWIAFGEYDGKPIIWRILEVDKTDDGSPMAFLLADGYVEEDRRFNLDGDNDWNSSEIKRWLNDDFYYAAFSEKEQDAIVNRTYYYGGEYEGSGRKATSKVFLLSMDDADRSIGEDWWLRSPGDFGLNAADVHDVGEVYGGNTNSSVGRSRAVRPALKINLASSIFTSSSSKYEILYPVTVEVRDTDADLMLGTAVASDNPKQQDFTGSDGTVLMKLGTGKQKIRVSVAGDKMREVTLFGDVKPGGGSYTVDLE